MFSTQGHTTQSVSCRPPGRFDCIAKACFSQNAQPFLLQQMVYLDGDRQTVKEKGENSPR